MSIENRNIKEGIQRLAGVWGKDYNTSFYAEIITADEQTRTVTAKPLSGNISSIISANLMPEPNDGFLMIPEVGSTVIITGSEKTNYFVNLYSDVSKIKMTIGNFEVVITENEMLLGDGSYNGLVKVSDLVTKLNNLENKVNQIITWGLTVSPIPLPPTPPLTLTTLTEIENIKIKHGI
jgi:hypothetical protein